MDGYLAPQPEDKACLVWASEWHGCKNNGGTVHFTLESGAVTSMLLSPDSGNEYASYE